VLFFSEARKPSSAWPGKSASHQIFFSLITGNLRAGKVICQSVQKISQTKYIISEIPAEIEQNLSS